MQALPLEKVFDLLGTTAVPGNPKELKALCVRLAELLDLNGEQWIRDHRQKLLDQWKNAVAPHA